ncbi:hypothetical protein Tco_0090551 [Tanacetum coccineum]
MYYQIFRGDGSSKNYKVLSEMLEDFDRQYLMIWDFNQHIEPMDMEHGSEKMKSPEKIKEEVVKESVAKRKKSLPRKRRIVKRQKLEEDAEKEELKGFLDIVPREEFAEDVESVSTKEMASSKNYKNGIAIHMLTEKKYPLSQEMITKMLNKRLEVDHESSQAFELLSTNGVSTASTYLVLPELVNTARRMINTADGQSC